MNLLPYQVRLLQDEYKKNIEEFQGLVESERERLEGKTIRAENGEAYDSDVHERGKQLQSRNEGIMRILDNASIITNYNESQISVGSTFAVCFIDEMEEETFTLIEEKVSNEGSTDGFITLNSDFGVSVHRKKVNETFAYKAPNGFLLSGIITKILTKEEQKEHFNKVNEEHAKRYMK